MTLAAVPVPSIAHHQLLVFLLQIGLVLGLATILGRLAVRLRLPAVVGELLVGVLLGPSLLGATAPGLSAWLFPADPGQLHLLDAVGQIGVLLLVGITGIHLNLGVIRGQGTIAVRTSAGGLLIPLGLGVAIGYLLPGSLLADSADRTVFALFLGVALCVSAIPVIAKILLEMRLLHRDIGQLTVSAAAVDDVVGWLLLSVVSAMATTGVRTGQVLVAVGSVLLVVVVAYLLGRPLVRGALRAANRSEDSGPTVAVVSILLLLSAAATHAMKLEAILGAFVCGIVIGSSGLLDHEKLAPLRTFTMAVLAPVFFATAGLRMDLTALAKPPVLLAAAGVLLAAVIGKFGGAYLGARFSGLSRWQSLAIGAGLNARGVIGLIVAMTGLRLGVLSTDAFTIVVLVAIVTSLITPPTLRYALRKIPQTDEEHTREKSFGAYAREST
ncbi:Kef-type K+ transport system, membrane component KefB [Actinokineospora iranica]|uniref:Kef-type K+ transport system, membrane component KefB n=2 Tax=Actinokineospora iranica TaxID=1271860 RepID=A0A1G6UCN4_9PSEU|nr:Kef-type K+ transport system, membrane component KefB [Actinokineospora iranica]